MGFPARRIINKMHNIDLDSIGHEVLEKAPEHVYENARLEIATRFGKYLLKKDGMIDTPSLGKTIFGDPDAMKNFNRVMRGPMSLLLRRRLMSLKGIVLINSALIAEENLSSMVNNDVIVVTATKEIQEERLRDRGYSNEVIRQRLSLQLSTDKKIEILKENQQKDHQGKIIVWDNSVTKHIGGLCHKLLKEIIDYGVL